VTLERVLNVDYGGSLFEEGKWVHLAVVVDRENDKYLLYKNGVLHDDPKDVSWIGSSNSNNDMILAPDALFRGTMDEIRIYDRALSSSEISSYYAANKPVHWLIFSAICDPYGATLYPWVKIDGQNAAYVSSVTRETHTVEVEDPWVFPEWGEFEFDRFTYDSTTDTSNPMTISVSKDTEIIAHYTLTG
jgi:hypothetical protein